MGVLNLNRLVQLFLTNPVVDTGTDTGWYYKKYADGTFEAWIKTDVIAISGLSQTGYNYYKHLEIASLPNIAKEVTSINATANSADFWVGNVSHSMQTRKVTAFMFRSIPDGHQSSLSLHILGKWK